MLCAGLNVYNVLLCILIIISVVVDLQTKATNKHGDVSDVLDVSGGSTVPRSSVPNRGQDYRRYVVTS